MAGKEKVFVTDSAVALLVEGVKSGNIDTVNAAEQSLRIHDLLLALKHTWRLLIIHFNLKIYKIIHGQRKKHKERLAGFKS